MSIRLQNIAKHFANTQALEPINLDIHEGELVGLLGPFRFGQNYPAAYHCWPRERR
ncbi:hypothetical protein HAALTHF_45900n [Vreelandella aquamarina]|nr:hypothetical protein HAALTHF_45900n [Halomonas axialensis]